MQEESNKRWEMVWKKRQLLRVLIFLVIILEISCSDVLGRHETKYSEAIKYYAKHVLFCTTWRIAIQCFCLPHSNFKLLSATNNRAKLLNKTFCIFVYFLICANTLNNIHFKYLSYTVAKIFILQPLSFVINT